MAEYRKNITMNLYQKYRPSSFKGLVAQDHVKTTLLNALKKDMLTHAYLFCGPRGTGKTSTARLLAKSINCEKLDSKTFEPCNKCGICEQINLGSLVDLVEIDAASNRGVDEIRELRDSVKFAPSQAKNKVYIIDEVHMLTKEAFNALLKTLEEPPTNVYFILATTELHKIPDTIVSRCQRFGFRRIDVADISKHLAKICKLEKIESEKKALEQISLRSEGCMRDALSLLDQLVSYGDVNVKNLREILGVSASDSVQEFVDNLLSTKIVENLDLIQEIKKDGVNLGEFSKSMLEVLQERLLKNIKDTELSLKIAKISQKWMEIYNQFRITNNLDYGLQVFCIEIQNLDSNPPTSSMGGQTNEERSKQAPSSPSSSGLDQMQVMQLINSKLKDLQASTSSGEDSNPSKVAGVELDLDELKLELQVFLEQEIEGKISQLKSSWNSGLDANTSDDENNSKTKIGNNLQKAIKVSKSLLKPEDTTKQVIEPDANFKIAELQRSWKKIVKKSAIPKLTRLLNEATLEKVEENLYLVFSSNFYLEQMQNPEFIEATEKLLFDHNYAVRVTPILKKEWIAKTLSSSNLKVVNKTRKAKSVKPKAVVEDNKAQAKPSTKAENKTQAKHQDKSTEGASLGMENSADNQNKSEEEADFNLEEFFDAELG